MLTIVSKDQRMEDVKKEKSCRLEGNSPRGKSNNSDTAEGANIVQGFAKQLLALPGRKDAVHKSHQLVMKEAPLKQSQVSSSPRLPTAIPLNGIKQKLKLTSIDSSNQIRILLLENVHQAAVSALSADGFAVEHHKSALPVEELKNKIADVHVIGIRSKTQLTRDVLQHAKKLLAIGCFCIGTNQVDLEAAEEMGIPVFNSPFSNSRSVAELVIAEIISLSRQVCDRSTECHLGEWKKVSAGCNEIRGKTLGIIGYGHIGSQLSVLAEALGMNVIFYDTDAVMPHGLATGCGSLADLLSEAHFVSLHVPETDETKNLIGKAELEAMRPGAYLINASRGTVVDIPALRDALISGHLAGAAVDVYPQEPASNTGKGGFYTPLQGLRNVILTPHIGGSTEEAQRAIGSEVSSSFLKYLHHGTTTNATNFPIVDVRIARADENKDYVRILNVHRNVPGVLREINQLLSKYNVLRQVTETYRSLGYVIADLELSSEGNEFNQSTREVLKEIRGDILTIPENIITRVVHSGVGEGLHIANEPVIPSV